MLNKEKLIKKHQRVPVVEYQNKTSQKPLVSIMVQTYQHVNYIGKCLDGILMQKTNFDIEILIGEDDSSDGTRDICIQYAKKHPDKIKLFLHSRENNIKVYGIPTGQFNYRYNMFSAKGKYIAICDGDDYWIDPLKLQKQTDILENNHDYGMVYSDIIMVDENGSEIKSTKFYNKQRTRYRTGSFFWNLLEKNFINTLTVCADKNLILDFYNNFPDEYFAYDHRFWLHLVSLKEIFFIDEKLACYRIHDNGISKSNGFFDKRRPLVRQSALLHYLSVINYKTELIDSSTFSKIALNIIKDKYLSKKEKGPIINIIKKQPKLLMMIIGYSATKLWYGKKFNKI